ncbi:MAG: hypothetical protein KBT35_05820 [Firmicutes bacterium]|nr:hypothetical protein [Candidatus Colivicinus equi]
MRVTDISDEQRKKILSQYSRLSFAKIQKNILQDLINNKSESVIYTRYDRAKVIEMLDNPQRYESDIRELSNFLYIVSGHYRRLVDYFATILLFNYTIIPNKITVEDIDAEKYKQDYIEVVNTTDKWNMEQEISNAMKIAIRDGVFYGICYESDDSFYVKPVNPKYAKISSIEDGVAVFSFDLDFFSKNKDLLEIYGKEFESAYRKYKPEGGSTNKENRWYEVKNQLVIEADPSDHYYHLPMFTSLLISVFDLDDYKMLQKAKSENDNYKALGLQLPTDEDGVPLMDFDQAEMYYEHIVDAISNENIGVFLSPFSVNDFSFTNGKMSDTNTVNDAEKSLFNSAGVTGGLFLSNLTSSSSILLSVKPDEQVAYQLLLQAQRSFNLKIKKLNLTYGFKVKFSQQSIFNNTEYVDRYAKASQYGLPVKSLYLSSLGFNASDLLGMTYLEEEILKLGQEAWLHPLVSSSVQSGVSSAESEDANGRPTAEESGEQIGDAGEASREQN